MIITLTPNPSVDRTIFIPQIRFNEVLRTNNVRLDWGGKGFNVSRSLRRMGIESLALGWVGGGAGVMLEDGLNKLGIHTDFVWVEEETRTNTVILEEGGEWYIKANEPGPHIPPQAVEDLLEKVDNYAKEGDILVASGSLPQEVPEDYFARLIQRMKAKGVRVFFDARDSALKLGCQEGPFLVKPNDEEAEIFVGFPIKNYEDAKRAALAFLRTGTQYVGITMGNQGLLMASQQEMVLAVPPKVPIRNVTGAGDSLMAGLVAATLQNLSLQEMARLGAACGTVSVMNEGISHVNEAAIQAMISRVETRVFGVM